MYIKKVYDLGMVIQVENHFPGNFGAPGCTRGKKRKRTPEDVRRQNAFNRERRVQRLILANFIPGDWHIVLNYRGYHPDTKEAVLKFRRFISNMRKQFKQMEVPFKYIAVTERGKKGKILHHHIIVQDMDGKTIQIIRKLWNYGTEYFYPLYEDGDFAKLSAYILKKDGKDGIGWESYTRSRNLIVPVPDKTLMKRKIWPEDPKPKRGFYIVKDSVINGVNPVTGYPYQYYAQKREK